METEAHLSPQLTELVRRAERAGRRAQELIQESVRLQDAAIAWLDRLPDVERAFTPPRPVRYPRVPSSAAAPSLISK